MPNSRRYHVLARRLKELRKHFLPVQFSPTGIYTKRQLDFARSYRLLAHAEIEHFIEDIAWEAVKSKVADWKNNKKASDLLICFLACYHAGWGDETIEEVSGSTGTKHKKASEVSAESAIEIARELYLKRIDQNHGVREENLRKILIPVGVRIGELSTTWLASMDSFGKDRGMVAHKRIGVQQAIDPRSEYDNIQALIIGLKELDEIVIKLSR